MNTPIVQEVLDKLIDELSSPREIELSIPGSPIEEQFIWEFEKVVSERCSISREVEAQTPIGLFRLDFVVEDDKGRKIGVECDGKEFHNSEKDVRRDAAIVSTGIVDKIYRLRGKDICWHIYEAIELLGWCEPWILSDRGKINLDARTLPESHRIQEKGDYVVFFPHAAIRLYDRTLDGHEDEDYEDEEVYPRRPIVIVWTQREKAELPSVDHSLRFEVFEL